MSTQITPNTNGNFPTLKITKRDPIIVLILIIVTCGIYGFFWIYQTRSEFAAQFNKPEINPTLDLILCIICFPYIIYLVYIFAKQINEAIEAQYGTRSSDDSIGCLILALIGLSMVSMMILQGNLNRLAQTQPHP